MKKATSEYWIDFIDGLIVFLRITQYLLLLFTFIFGVGNLID